MQASARTLRPPAPQAAPQNAVPHARARRRRCAVWAQVHARWTLDVKYGRKQEATSLLQQWVAQVGSRAGLHAGNTRLASGSIGCPESRLELEVTLPSLDAFERFLAAVPGPEHKAWSQRVQSMVVDGSPMWQVHRSIPLLPDAAGTGVGSASSSSSSSSSASSSPSNDGSKQLVFTNEVPDADVALWQQQLATGAVEQASPQQAPQQPLDWKGEPMSINPGDKLPFKFL